MNGKEGVTASPEAREGEGTANEDASQKRRNAPKKRKHETERSAPTLSWMRVPVEIKAGDAVPLSAVRGLHSLLPSALCKGERLSQSTSREAASKPGFLAYTQIKPSTFCHISIWNSVCTFYARHLVKQNVMSQDACRWLILHDEGLQIAMPVCAAGYEELFPVQAASWRTLAGGMSTAHDLCICAPTGSGKTLAYALPILQRLIG